MYPPLDTAIEPTSRINSSRHSTPRYAFSPHTNSTATHTAATCAELGRAAFHLVAGAAIGRASPIARAVADLEVLLTHRMVADRVLPTAARVLLGQAAPADL